MRHGLRITSALASCVTAVPPVTFILFRRVLFKSTFLLRSVPVWELVCSMVLVVVSVSDLFFGLAEVGGGAAIAGGCSGVLAPILAVVRLWVVVAQREGF